MITSLYSKKRQNSNWTQIQIYKQSSALFMKSIPTFPHDKIDLDFIEVDLHLAGWVNKHGTYQLSDNQSTSMNLTERGLPRYRIASGPWILENGGLMVSTKMDLDVEFNVRER
jgi:hypothetical protein